ncbi:MAG TPA: hypothetical protein PKH54_09815 [Myxococcota bacterium]|nr:hypothetical protein [Myxococcota bacterium]
MMRFEILRRAGGYLFPASAVLLVLAAIGGCQYDFTYYRSTYVASNVEFVSAVPVELTGGTPQRHCVGDDGAGVNALELAFNILSPGSQTTAGEADDRDLSIRPGELIKTPDEEYLTLGVDGVDSIPCTDPDKQGQTCAPSGYRLLRPSHFSVDIDCLSPYPLAGFEKACSTKQTIKDARPDTLNYQSNFTSGPFRGKPEESNLSVAVMIDQSGSMIGYVEPLTQVEYSPGLKTANGAPANVSSEGFADRATDYNAFRRTAAQRLFGLLNKGDRAGIFKFGEDVSADGARILCTSANDDESLNRADCFGINRDILNSPVFSDLQNTPRGRTPLWMAVKDVYDFMKTETTPVKHIVVITDGPDTCAQDSPDFLPYVRYFRVSTKEWELGDQSAACSDTSYKAFLAHIHDDVYDQNGNPKPIDQIPVHITFIQMQSKGYPMIDPAQQEIACLTGGHYTWINSNDLPASREENKDNLAAWAGQHPLEQALLTPITRFRNAMSGVWRMAVKVNDLSAAFSAINVSFTQDFQPVVNRAEGDVIEDVTVTDTNEPDVDEPDTAVDTNTPDVLDDASADVPAEDTNVVDVPSADEGPADVAEEDTNEPPVVSPGTCQEKDSPCDCTKKGTGVVTGASVAVDGRIRALLVEDLTDSVFPSSASSAFVVDKKIDMRGAVRLPEGKNASDCLSWFPLCSIADDLVSTVKDLNNSNVQMQARDVECLAVAFDDEFAVCSYGEMAFSSPCTGGSCCWGKCIPPNDNECREDVLDEGCNYQAKAFETECSAEGKCCKGICVPKNDKECKTSELNQSSCTYKNKDDGTDCTGGKCQGGECIPSAG